ncbi:MAG: hypothetical protein AAF429_01515 [Pseudomonadota bacterium]
MTAQIQRLKISDGHYRGGLTYKGAVPKISLLLNGEKIAKTTIKKSKKGEAELSVDLPELKASGHRDVFALVNDADDALLDVFSVGLDADTNLRSEVEALRQELELLKTAFRRQNNTKK